MVVIALAIVTLGSTTVTRRKYEPKKTLEMVAEYQCDTLVLVPTTAAVAADPPHLITPGTLTWGVSVTFAPLEFIKDGKAVPKDPTYTGLDVCTPQTAASCVGGGS